MSRLRLLKLLYVADRESLTETARSITGDHAVAMQHGPVLTRVYDCIKDCDANSARWRQHFRSAGKQDVVLTGDSGNGHLSRYEIEKLQSVATRYEDLDDWSLAELTHEFSEWERHRPMPGRANPIPHRHVLEAVGLGDQADEILEEARAYRALDDLLQGTVS